MAAAARMRDADWLKTVEERRRDSRGAAGCSVCVVM